MFSLAETETLGRFQNGSAILEGVDSFLYSSHGSELKVLSIRYKVLSMAAIA